MRTTFEAHQVSVYTDEEGKIIIYQESSCPERDDEVVVISKEQAELLCSWIQKAAKEKHR